MFKVTAKWYSKKRERCNHGEMHYISEHVTGEGSTISEAMSNLITNIDIDVGESLEIIGIRGIAE